MTARMHPHPHWILSAEKQKEEALQRNHPSVPVWLWGAGAFFCCHLFCQLLRDVAYYKPKAEVSGKHQDSCSPLARGMGTKRKEAQEVEG